MISSAMTRASSAMSLVCLTAKFKSDSRCNIGAAVPMLNELASEANDVARMETISNANCNLSFFFKFSLQRVNLYPGRNLFFKFPLQRVNPGRSLFFKARLDMGIARDSLPCADPRTLSRKFICGTNNEIRINLNLNLNKLI